MQPEPRMPAPKPLATMPSSLWPTRDDLGPQTARLSSKRRSRDTPSVAALVTERLPAKTLLYHAVKEQQTKQCAGAALAAVSSGADGMAPSAVVGAADGAFDEEQAQAAPSLLPGAGEPLTMTAPRASSGGSSVRVREYMLLRAVHLVRGSAHATEMSMDGCRTDGLDGWRSDDGHHVGFFAPGEVLLLVDDDKQTRLAQAFLPDMFMRLGLQGRGE